MNENLFICLFLVTVLNSTK